MVGAEVVSSLLLFYFCPAGLVCVISLLVQAKEAESALSQREGKEPWRKQVLAFNLPLSAHSGRSFLPPGAFYQRAQIQADISRLGRRTLRKKEKQMFSEYMAKQDRFSLGLAW